MGLAWWVGTDRFEAGLRRTLRRQLAESRASRSRLVRADHQVRRRMERDLHDGVQQRLVSLSLLLARARRETGGSPALDAAIEQLQAALGDLRELARGVYPLGLAEEGGLARALAQLADGAGLPTVVEAVPDDPLPEEVRTAAYFVASEAVTNAVKHAAATCVRIAAVLEGGRLLVEVRDDGRGGAAVERGGGLAGLLDRVEALDGNLRVESPPHGGTAVRVELPCPSVVVVT